jgi:hypothetical protein
LHRGIFRVDIGSGHHTFCRPTDHRAKKTILNTETTAKFENENRSHSEQRIKTHLVRKTRAEETETCEWMEVVKEGFLLEEKGKGFRSFSCSMET